jgi:hypothetical protein
MMSEIFRFGPEILQARDPPNPVDEIEVGRPIVGVQPDEEHIKDMGMRIERFSQNLFDKTVARQIALLAKQHSKVCSTLHKAAAGRSNMRTDA